MTSTVHKYYKKSIDGLLVLVQLDPVHLKGVELQIDPHGHVLRTEREFDEDIYEDLAIDDFETASPLEFNLYLQGLSGN